MKNKQLTRFLFIFLVLISTFFTFAQQTIENRQEITLVENQQKMLQEINQTAGTVTYRFSDKDSAIKIEKDLYLNVIPENNASYVKTDSNGSLIEADLIASKDTTWTFGNQTLKISNGTRVIFKNKELQIFNKNNTYFKIENKNLGINEKIQSMRDGTILIKENNAISGKEFQIGDLNINGEVFIVSEGYLLNNGTIGNLKSLEIIADKNEILIVKPEINLTKLQNRNYIAPGNVLEANGEGFSLEFKPGNPWANVRENSKLKLDFEKKIKINMDNRDNENLAPLFLITRSNYSLLKINNGELSASYGTTSDKTIQNNGQDTNKAIFTKLLTSNKNGYLSVPLELKDLKNNNDESWYFDNSGNIVDSIYRVSEISELTPEQVANFKKSTNNTPIDSSARRVLNINEKTRTDNQLLKAKVLMDREGNIKYPIYQAYSESTLFNDRKLGEFLNLIKNNEEKYYLDDTSLRFLNQTFNVQFGSDHSENAYWKELIRLYPEDSRIKQVALDNINSLDADIYYGKELPAGWVSFGGLERDSIPMALTLLRGSPDLQKAYLEKIRLTVKEKEIDANLLMHSAQASSDGVVFRTVLDKYGSELTDEEYTNWQTTYRIYHGFDSYFPSYTDLGLTDIQKLQFVKNEVFQSQYAVDPNTPLPLEEIKKAIEDYTGKSDKVIFDSTYDMFSYNYPTNGMMGANENFAITPATLAEKNNFNSQTFRDVTQDGFSLTTRIKEDLANPGGKKIYLFNNHGGPDTQYVGAKFYIWSIEISDSDIANSLLKGYIDSSENPQKRTFGDKVIICDSCYSGDFIENTKTKLVDQLASRGINPDEIKLPIFISSTDKGKLGFTTSDEKNSLILRLMEQMNNNNNKLTLEEFIEARNRMLTEEYFNNPQILMNYK